MAGLCEGGNELTGSLKAICKPRCTAVTPRNEERLDQLLRKNRQIATRDLSTELNVGFNALETMLATLGYRKVCARLLATLLDGEEGVYKYMVQLKRVQTYRHKADALF
ncbi:hypothetical protein ANN_06637 [Periplaneta americana]|uniref:Uncharacterized protein n=1 Tax=Periplaneta americana TaxID=6978 RepID=A0ABQ8TGM2_PERAM|nr:hypothetical protein ANN_06637 [Periplaneta americana]